MDEKQNQNANRDIFNIGNLQGDVTVVNEVKPSQRPKTEKFLIKIVKAEVANRLEHSLNNAVLMTLEKESQPDQVYRLWDTEIKTGTKLNKEFYGHTSILDIFDRDDIAGNLLILGSPGSGKTVTMLELTKVLIERAEQQNDYPIPVLFNLASWNNDNSLIIDWLISELKRNYGVRIDIGKKLLENHKILPILDGLDELKPLYQEPCVLAINNFILSDNRPIHIVVCSRKEEYENYESKLLLMNSIILKPFTYLQIRDYLTSVHRNDLWKAIRLYDELLNLLSIPLFLHMAVLAEEELSVEEWRQLISQEARIQFLMNAYIRRMLSRRIKNYSYKNEQPTTKQTKEWLIWLSRILQKESKTELLIEELQPYLLEREQLKKYIYQYYILGIVSYIPVGGIISFCSFFTFGFMLMAMVKGINGFLFISICSIFGVIGAISMGGWWIELYMKNIEVIDFRFAENRVFSWRKAISSIRTKTDYWVIQLFLTGFIIIYSVSQGETIGFFIYTFVSLIILSCLYFYLLGISHGPEIVIKNIPNQGILKEYKDFKNKYLGLHFVFWVLSSLTLFSFSPYVLISKIITVRSLILSG